MAATSFLAIFFLSHFVLLFSAKEEDAKQQQQHCPPFQCGKLGNISFPFFDTTVPKCGGLCEVDCHTNTIKLGNESQLYEVDRISQANVILIRDRVLEQNPLSRNCNALKNISLPNSPSISFSFIENTPTFFICNVNSEHTYGTNFSEYHSYKECLPGYSLFYTYPNESVFTTGTLPSGCSAVQLPAGNQFDDIACLGDLLRLVTPIFHLRLHVSADCSECHSKGGKCDTDQSNKFHCANLKQGIAAYPIPIPPTT